jgi:hypothetical protein
LVADLCHSDNRIAANRIADDRFALNALSLDMRRAGGDELEREGVEAMLGL